MLEKYKVEYFSGNNGRSFEKTKEISYQGCPAYLFNSSIDLAKALKEKKTKNQVDVLLMGDVWGFELPENLDAFNNLLDIISDLPVIWFVMSSNIFNKSSFPNLFKENNLERFIDGVDRFVVVSPDIKEELIRIGVKKENVIFIPPPIDTKLFNIIAEKEKSLIKERNGILRSRIVLTHIGRFCTGKGTYWLMDAFDKIRREFKEVLHLNLVGDTYPDYAESQEWLERKSRFSQKNTGFFTISDGFISDQRTLSEHYKMTDFFIFPSYMYEGMPMTLLKSFLCGVPAVTSSFQLTSSGAKSLLKENVNCLTFSDYKDELELRTSEEIRYKSFVSALKLGMQDQWNSKDVRNSVFDSLGDPSIRGLSKKIDEMVSELIK